MNSSTQRTRPDESPKRFTAESEDDAIRAHRFATDQMVAEMVEGLRKLARQKALEKRRHTAA